VRVYSGGGGVIVGGGDGDSVTVGIPAFEIAFDFVDDDDVDDVVVVVRVDPRCVLL
jgi:hypothetical protein